MAARRRLPTLPNPDATKLPDAITSAVGFLVREVTTLFHLSFEQVLIKHHLRPRQYLMLLVLRDEGPMAQNALGQRLGMDRTTTMQSLLALEESGAIVREDDPADRRIYRVSLTPEGQRLATTLEEHIGRAEAELLAPLSPLDRESFATHLRTILGGMVSTQCASERA